MGSRSFPLLSRRPTPTFGFDVVIHCLQGVETCASGGPISVRWTRGSRSGSTRRAFARGGDVTWEEHFQFTTRMQLNEKTGEYRGKDIKFSLRKGSNSRAQKTLAKVRFNIGEIVNGEDLQTRHFPVIVDNYQGSLVVTFRSWPLALVSPKGTGELTGSPSGQNSTARTGTSTTESPMTVTDDPITLFLDGKDRSTPPMNEFLKKELSDLSSAEESTTTDGLSTTQQPWQLREWDSPSSFYLNADMKASLKLTPCDHDAKPSPNAILLQALRKAERAVAAREDEITPPTLTEGEEEDEEKEGKREREGPRSPSNDLHVSDDSVAVRLCFDDIEKEPQSDIPCVPSELVKDTGIRASAPVEEASDKSHGVSVAEGVLLERLHEAKEEAEAERKRGKQQGVVISVLNTEIEKLYEELAQISARATMEKDVLSRENAVLERRYLEACAVCDKAGISRDDQASLVHLSSSNEHTAIIGELRDVEAQLVESKLALAEALGTNDAMYKELRVLRSRVTQQDSERATMEGEIKRLEEEVARRMSNRPRIFHLGGNREAKETVRTSELGNEQGRPEDSAEWEKILENWVDMQNTRKLRRLWQRGIPNCFRGRVWQLAIGNALQITPELYSICMEQVRKVRETIAASRTPGPRPQSPSREPSYHLSRDSSIQVVDVDLPRTFPHLGLFRPDGGCYHELRDILSSFVLYRPDVGYVQGMSYLGAMLILFMDPYPAFVCLANLVATRSFFLLFRMEVTELESYFLVYNALLEQHVPSVHSHFDLLGIRPEMFLMDWTLTLFSRVLPLDLACRVWDNFLLFGDIFIFKTALGILRLHERLLSTGTLDECLGLLSNLPETVNETSLFDAIESVAIQPSKFERLLTTHGVPFPPPRPSP